MAAEAPGKVEVAETSSGRHEFGVRRSGQSSSSPGSCSARGAHSTRSLQEDWAWADHCFASAEVDLVQTTGKSSAGKLQLLSERCTAGGTLRSLAEFHPGFWLRLRLGVGTECKVLNAQVVDSTPSGEQVHASLLLHATLKGITSSNHGLTHCERLLNAAPAEHLTTPSAGSELKRKLDYQGMHMGRPDPLRCLPVGRCYKRQAVKT